MLIDPRFEALAKQITDYSTKVQKGDNVLIDVSGTPEMMTVALVRAVQAKGAHPFVNQKSAFVTRELIRGAQSEGLHVQRDYELAQMKSMDVYIAIRGGDNIFELSDLDPDQMSLAMRELKPVLDWRVQKTRWVIMRWPTPAMAQQSMMSTERFEELFFNVCNLDYAAMMPGMEALKAWFEKTDRVHITGNGTDLRFSIKDIPAIICGGGHNLPDGEVFTAPVRDSVEGHIQYNAPTVYQGSSFDDVYLRFENGKIVQATSSDTEKLNKILDSDEGARYIGEFAIGFNPHILEPMRDILFDEKIAGSFHFTPGQAYEDADNSNRSQVHWDLVNIQRPDYGGGEIWFDDTLLRKDGIFLPEDLQSLNP